MHGLINKALQSFVTHTYGRDCWLRIVDRASLGFADYEAMLSYPADQTTQVLAAMGQELDRPLQEILEDVGTYLVSHPELEALRRLLRFGGETYTDFLYSLDELPERARLAVSDLHLPALDVIEQGPNHYVLAAHEGLPGYGCVLMGILRSMADDYGTLAMLDRNGDDQSCGDISVTVVESAFAAGRDFVLGGGQA